MGTPLLTSHEQLGEMIEGAQLLDASLRCLFITSLILSVQTERSTHQIWCASEFSHSPIAPIQLHGKYLSTDNKDIKSGEVSHCVRKEFCHEKYLTLMPHRFLESSCLCNLNRDNHIRVDHTSFYVLLQRSCASEHNPFTNNSTSFFYCSHFTRKL